MMGNTVWFLQMDQDSDDWDHSYMLKCEKQLNQLCQANGVLPFSELLDHAILEEEYTGEAGEPNWLDAAAVLAVLVPLHATIDGGGGRIKPNDRSELLEELADCISKAEQAAELGIQIRLSVVP